MRQRKRPPREPRRPTDIAFLPVRGKSWLGPRGELSSQVTEEGPKNNLPYSARFLRTAKTIAAAPQTASTDPTTASAIQRALLLVSNTSAETILLV